MKKVTDITNVPPVKGLRKIQPAKSNAFHEKLAEAQSKHLIDQSPQPRTESLGEIQAPSFTRIEQSSGSVVNKTHELLDLLSHYTRDIESPNKTLKDIEPLIISMQQQASQLVKAATETSPELRKIAQEVAVAANVEYIKFYRGDYNS
ncbi:MAG: hypothetical protein JRH18_14535 [Deltaproteobacteria bacterium]|nr:hypothetical protein [Deltaproteobacteria bacterium]MBW2152873.1 hypothetical protein [Deltaproteobacteria bacterium]